MPNERVVRLDLGCEFHGSYLVTGRIGTVDEDREIQVDRRGADRMSAPFVLEETTTAGDKAGDC